MSEQTPSPQSNPEAITGEHLKHLIDRRDAGGILPAAEHDRVSAFADSVTTDENGRLRINGGRFVGTETVKDAQTLLENSKGWRLSLTETDALYESARTAKEMASKAGKLALGGDAAASLNKTAQDAEASIALSQRLWDEKKVTARANAEEFRNKREQKLQEKLDAAVREEYIAAFSREYAPRLAEASKITDARRRSRYMTWIEESADKAARAYAGEFKDYVMKNGGPAAIEYAKQKRLKETGATFAVSSDGEVRHLNDVSEPLYQGEAKRNRRGLSDDVTSNSTPGSTESDAGNNTRTTNTDPVPVLAGEPLRTDVTYRLNVRGRVRQVQLADGSLVDPGPRRRAASEPEPEPTGTGDAEPRDGATAAGDSRVPRGTDRLSRFADDAPEVIKGIPNSALRREGEFQGMKLEELWRARDEQRITAANLADWNRALLHAQVEQTPADVVRDVEEQGIDLATVDHTARALILAAYRHEGMTPPSESRTPAPDSVEGNEDDDDDRPSPPPPPTVRGIQQPVGSGQTERAANHAASQPQSEGAAETAPVRLRRVRRVARWAGDVITSPLWPLRSGVDALDAWDLRRRRIMDELIPLAAPTEYAQEVIDARAKAYDNASERGRASRNPIRRVIWERADQRIRQARTEARRAARRLPSQGSGGADTTPSARSRRGRAPRVGGSPTRTRQYPTNGRSGVEVLDDLLT